ADWPAIGINLATYAARIGRRYGWRGTMFPKGHGPADFANQAIKKVIEGTRKWDPDKVDLETLLRGVVRGDMSHFVKKKGTHIEVSLDAIPDALRPRREEDPRTAEDEVTAEWTDELTVEWLIIEIKHRVDQHELLPIVNAIRSGGVIGRVGDDK